MLSKRPTEFVAFLDMAGADLSLAGLLTPSFNTLPPSKYSTATSLGECLSKSEVVEAVVVVGSDGKEARLLWVRELLAT